MKRSLLILFSLCSSLSLSAQKIHFTDTSNVWKELEPQYNAPYPWILNYDTYSFIGDSTIGAVNYKWFSFDYGVCGGCGSLVREDTILKKVYIRDLAGDSDMVLMDYNLNVGDTFTTKHNRFVVTSIDSTLINSVWHRVWHFPAIPGGGIYGSTAIYVVEGIGCIQHPTYMLWDFSGCVECSQPAMYCFSNNSITPPLSPPVSFFDNTTSCATYPTLHAEQLQLNEHKITIYPNPTQNELSISSPNKITQITITNLLGQTVYTHEYSAEKVQVDIADLPTGVYVLKINGSEVRKFVKR